MSLTLIATPIGNLEDITLRALKKLKASEYLICEEAKVTRRRLSFWEIDPKIKKIFELNEHSKSHDVDELLQLCKNHDVSLVTDCGTPSFFDPGFLLVKACKKNDVPVFSLPGVSSLTALIPYLDRKTEHFEVLGFPPQKNEDREQFFKNLLLKKTPFLIMDTPYRLQKTIEELSQTSPNFYCVLGVNLTCNNETLYYGTPHEIKAQIKNLKKENFVCMAYPS